MKVKNKSVKKILDHYNDIATLANISALLSWDLNVNLPAKASESRASQNALITKLISDRWADKEFKDRVTNIGSSDLTFEEKAIVRNLKYIGKYYFQVPQKIIIEFSKTSSRAYVAWQDARKSNDFKKFLPHLKKLIKLNKIIAGYLGDSKNPYDPLLDVYEPGLTASQCKEIFSKLQPELTRLIKNYKNKKTSVDISKLSFPINDQIQVANFVLRKIGYDLNAGRMDKSAHPFTTELGMGDVRITNRYKPSDFVESIMVAMHEGGHALYEQGVNENYHSTPLAGGVSLGIHESQSRFWENQVGRSYEFVKFLTPVLHAFYHEQIGNLDTDELFSIFNQVRPSLIRVEADELTYNLHIILRFEIENDLINDRLKPEELPEVWNKKMKKYLGIVPPNDADGVLQDVHWSQGSFGYFPTYTLGNLYAAQFTHFMKKEIDTAGLIESGQLGTILSWQREHIHQHGSLYWPSELIKKVTGKKLDSQYFIDYLKNKYK